MKTLALIVLMIIASTINAQSTPKSKYYFKTGIGAAYSFFKTDSAPFPTPTLAEINAKDAIGRVIDFEIGRNLRRNFSLSLRFSDHKFVRAYYISDTLINTTTIYTLHGKLYRHQYYYQILINKEFSIGKRSLLGAGIGYFFVTESDQFYSAFAGNPGLGYPTVNLSEYPNLEGGGPVAIYYERKINPFVSLGIKSQAYVIVSVGSFESISINPYIKASF